MTTPNAMIEADLHGLVDGQVDAARRAGVLRLLSASPADRAQVEAWQTQGDLLRSAFADVDREPIPVTLELKTRPPLHCVPANDAPLVTPVAQPRQPRHRIASLATAVIIAAGLFGSWTVLSQVEPDDGMETATTPHGAGEAIVASRTAAALDTATAGDVTALMDLPTARIPDLHAAGFGLVGATTVGAQPPAIVFRYQNKSADRVVLSVARTAEPGTTQPAPLGAALTWKRGDTVYAMAGTVDRRRLRAIAATLQQADR